MKKYMKQATWNDPNEEEKKEEVAEQAADENLGAETATTVAEETAEAE